MVKAALRVASAVAPLVLAQAALAVPPTGTISVTPVSPDRPNVGDDVTFEATGVNWGGTAGTIVWAFGDGQGATTLQANHAYASAGAKSVTAVLTNGEAEAATIGPVAVQVNTPPIALLGDFNPVDPFPGIEVLFTSESADPDGDPVTHVWDFGDGITSPNRNPRHAFASDGTKTVTLTVTDPFGGSDTATEDVNVVVPTQPNDPPRARFVYAPRSPVVGDEIDLVSTSVDPEDALREQRWDLDGDGEFDDARGDEVIHAFTKPGPHRVRLRVEDAGGKSAEQERVITVKKAPPVPAGYLLPPPGIVLTATVLPTGVRVQDLTVQAPRGSRIRVTCRGKTCGARQRSKRSKGRLVHFKTYRHFLRAGVRLAVYVWKPGMIGSYKRYTVEAKSRGTKSISRCLSSKRQQPIRCR